MTRLLLASSPHNLVPTPRRSSDPQGLWRAGVAAAALGAGLSLAGCGKEETPPEAPRLVETIVAASDTAAASSTYSGQVVSKYSADYGFRVGGMLIARDVEVGQQVVAGQVLARLDPKDIDVNVRNASAQTAASAAQAQAQTADLARSRQLVAEGFMSKAEFDRVKAGAESSQAQLNAARAQQTGAQQQLSYTVLRATRAGVVTAVNGDVGEVVPAGQPVVSVAAPGSLEVAISIPEGEVARFRGARLGVRLWTQPDQVFPATIRTLAGAANPQTRTFDARVSFTAPGGQAAIGGTAEVVAYAGQGAQGVAVPTTAVIPTGANQVVWVVSGTPAKVQPRTVTLGAVHDDDVIIATGVKPGERIVTAGGHLLRPGQSVRPIVSSTDANR